MPVNLLDRELKKGSAELLILSLVEDQPRHGYDIGQLIALRSRVVRPRQKHCVRRSCQDVAATPGFGGAASAICN